MKTFKHMFWLLLLSLIIISCEKNNPVEDVIPEMDDKPTSQLKASQINSSEASGYLMDLINTIETLFEEGLLNKGNTNALISTIENAIKSYEKGNMKPAINLLGAFINQMEAFVANGTITEEIGGSLINMAENGVILLEGSFFDPRDGQVYSVVLIGDQIWMAENLRAKKYSDGTAITLTTQPAEWYNLSSDGKAFCWYAFVEYINNTYGALYNWEAAMNGASSSDENPSGVQGVCPSGWHLPSDEEWKIMEMFLGMSRADADSDDPRGTDEGGKLKEAGTEHWASPNVGATNESGFTALPASQVHPDGRHYTDHRVAFFWTSTRIFSWEAAYDRYIWTYSQQVMRDTDDLTFGFSVRCIKD